jgi:hypothetical protein
MSALKFPVNSVNELATLLGMSEHTLWRIANTASESYIRWKKTDEESGKERDITTPKPRLKNIQNKLHKLIFSHVKYGYFAHCGLKGRSNITNAREHHGCKVIHTFDIKSFFPSVHPERVKKELIDDLGCPPSVASLITKLVTVDYQLPQGAPTSTDIANIVTLRLQRRLYPLAKQWGIRKFTIYADDIAFSGDNIPSGFIKMAEKIVRKEGFKIHPDKGGTFNKSHEMIVTGINVAHGEAIGKKKKAWRAERHQNLIKFQKGEISVEEHESSEAKYVGRMAYANCVRKS